MHNAATAGGLWRRALQALAHAFDPAREVGDEDTVFQIGPARQRSEPRDPPHPPEETLQ